MIKLALVGYAFCMSLVEVDYATAICHGIDIRELTIRQVHHYYDIGWLTPKKLTRCYLNRIKSLNPHLGAVIETNPLAIPQFEADNIAVDGMQTTAGSFFLYDVKPKHEALAVKRLRKQGAIILGKTNLSELSGLLAFDTKHGFSHRGGLTRNPYNLTSEIYGSSSGSAAAVAANLAMAALGTDTLGSIVAPASVTSLYGFKPTYTSALAHGLIPLAKSMDTVGVMTRTAEDCIIVARAITRDNKLGRPLLKSLEGIRIGVLDASESDLLDLIMHYSQMEHNLKYLNKKGAIVVKLPALNLPIDYKRSVLEHMVCEFGHDIHKYLAKDVKWGPHSQNNIKGIKSIIEWYQKFPISQNYSLEPLHAADPKSCTLEPGVLAFPKYHQETQTNLTQLFYRQNLDAIIMPSHPSVNEFYLPNVAGYPTLNIPVGYKDDGSSFGLLIYGQSRSDTLLLKISKVMERYLPFYRKPPQFQNLSTKFDHHLKDQMNY